MRQEDHRIKPILVNLATYQGSVSKLIKGVGDIAQCEGFRFNPQYKVGKKEGGRGENGQICTLTSVGEGLKPQHNLAP